MSKQSNATEGATEPSQNLSFEELVAQRTSRYAEPEEPTEDEQPKEQPEELEEETPEEQPEETEEELTEDEPDDEAPEIDLLSLSPAQIQDLAKKGKSRLLHRIGELTAQKHALEERLNTQPQAKPLPSIPTAENPFRDLKTADEIQAKYQELEKVAEETDRILEDHEDYAADDVIDLGGKEFTKKQIRLANRNARDAMLKYLPAQHAEIVRSEQRVQMQAAYQAAIPKEVPEVLDEESELGKQFKSMLTDPLVEQVRERVPDLAPQLDYLLAHALRSISQKATAKPPTAAAPTRGKIPSSPFGAAGPRSGTKPARKQVEEATSRFEKTGTVDDWIAARAAKLQNR